MTLPISLYFALSEASTRQATWGKRKKGLTVARGDGKRLSVLRSIGRTALKFIPWELAHECIWQLRFAGAGRHRFSRAAWFWCGFLLAQTS